VINALIFVVRNVLLAVISPKDLMSLRGPIRLVKVTRNQLKLKLECSSKYFTLTTLAIDCQEYRSTVVISIIAKGN
jgi:hypothetical protein